MLATALFTDTVDALTPDAFRAHFLTRGTVVYPEVPSPTAAQLSNADKILANCFDLVGEEYTLPANLSWQLNPSGDKEWLIAQHKFYFAVDLIQAYRTRGNAAYLRKWLALIDSWLAEMGSGFITASDAQVEAKRIQHWVESFALLRGTPWAEVVPPQFLRRFLERIAMETGYVAAHLKPARNHRTFQLFSVFLVGVLFPEFRHHAEFLRLGATGLTENLLADFLPDGVHVELSTHYHQLVVETALAFVEIARANGIPLDPALLTRLARALEFSAFMQWPNGDIPLIGDADNGDHRAMLERGSRLLGDERLLWAASLGHAGTPPDVHSRHFDCSGYLVFSDGWGSDPRSFAARQHVFFDCALLGEGSHSHYDLFNFCYYAAGEPIVIDPGRYTYSAAPDRDGIDWREQFKSTAYHNTVTIDRRDQTRYISKARRNSSAVRPPGTPKHGPAVEIIEPARFLGARTDWVAATARSAEYAPLHHRLCIYPHRQYLFVFDQIECVDGEHHDCVARFHLPSTWLGRVSLRQEGQEVVARLPAAQFRAYHPAGQAARVERGWVSTRYGVKEAAPVIALAQAGAQSLVFCTVIAPASRGEVGLEIWSLRLLSATAAGTFLFRVDGRRGGGAFSDHVLVQRGDSATFDGAGVSFRGRFLAWRQDARDQITDLVAQQVERLVLADAPPLITRTTERFEWSV